MRKLEFDGIIGAIDEKTNKLVLRVGDRYFFRGNMIVEPYASKKEEGVAKAQIKVFVSEKPELIYRKKDTAPVPAAPAEPCDDVDDLPF